MLEWVGDEKESLPLQTGKSQRQSDVGGVHAGERYLLLYLYEPQQQGTVRVRYLLLYLYKPQRQQTVSEVFASVPL